MERHFESCPCTSPMLIQNQVRMYRIVATVVLGLLAGCIEISSASESHNNSDISKFARNDGDNDGVDYFVTQPDCKITLEHLSPNSPILAHRSVLAASIPYFRDMFVMSDTSKVIEVKLSAELDIRAIESLVKFAYTQHIRITSTNVELLFSAALFLRLNSVVDACVKFKYPRFTPHSVIGILNMTNFDFPMLTNAAEEYAHQHFDNVSRTEAILDLRADAFLNLIRSNELNISNEADVCDLAIRWLERNPIENMAERVFQVLRNIRYPLLDLHYLGNLVNQNVVNSSIPIRKLIRDAIGHILHLESNSALDGCQTSPRNGLTHFYYFDRFHNQIFEPIGERRPQTTKVLVGKGFCVAVNECNIYIIGGLQQRNELSSVHKYHPKSSRWTTVAPMHVARYLASAATMNGVTYVSGGRNDTTLLTVEYYNPITNTWTMVAPMKSPRAGHQLVVLGQYLYALGGRSAWNVPLSTMERYDAQKDEWSEGNPMLFKRQGFGVAEWNGKLYVCGGYQIFGENVLDSAEVYDPVSRTWRMIRPMSGPRNWFSLVAHQTKLYAVGGIGNVHTDLNTIDVYDPEANTWTLETDVKRTEGITVKLNI